MFALLRSFERTRDLANTFDNSMIGGFAKSQSRSKSLSHIRTFKIYNAPAKVQSRLLTCRDFCLDHLLLLADRSWSPQHAVGRHSPRFRYAFLFGRFPVFLCNRPALPL